MKDVKVSILIANYNNNQYIDECINSLLKQSYKKIEIIFFDDKSSDNSIKTIKKFKDVIIINNKKKKNFYGSFNQINAYKQAFKKATGEIIFFLDSDDFFHYKKIDQIIKVFSKYKNINAVYDLPIYKSKNKSIQFKIKKKLIKNYWSYIPPHSCLAIRKNCLSNIFKLIDFNLFPDIWMDFRVGIVLQHICKKFVLYKKNLTFYRQSDHMISSKFKHLTRNWWKRRLQAHQYVQYFFFKKKISYKKNLDFFITFFVGKFFI